MEQSFLHIIAQASVVAKIVLGILCVMSLISWALMLQKSLVLRSARRKAIAGTEKFLHAANLREAVQSLGTDTGSPLFYVTQQGVDEFNRLKTLGNSNDIVVANVERSLRQGVAAQMNRMSSSIAFLATTANTAPFIGLFGTVWGIMYSFQSIGLMKSASLATVAPGISEALIATALGLAVAIPATVGYNMFLGMMTSIEVQMDTFAVVFLNRVQREINAPQQSMSTPASTPSAAPATPMAHTGTNMAAGPKA